jgi:hypothetical protein
VRERQFFSVLWINCEFFPVRQSNLQKRCFIFFPFRCYQNVLSITQNYIVPFRKLRSLQRASDDRMHIWKRCFPLLLPCTLMPLRLCCKRVRIQIIPKRLFMKLNAVTCCVTSLSCVSDRGYAQSWITNHHQHIQQNPVQRWDSLLLSQNAT